MCLILKADLSLNEISSVTEINSVTEISSVTEINSVLLGVSRLTANYGNISGKTHIFLCNLYSAIFFLEYNGFL